MADRELEEIKEIDENTSFIDGVVNDPETFSLSFESATMNQTALVRRTIHFLKLTNIIGSQKISISFKENMKEAGACEHPRTSADYFNFTYDSGLTESHIDDMLDDTCAHEVTHAYIHFKNPDGATPPHGREWLDVMRRLQGIEQPSVKHRASVSEANGSGGYVFCGCEEGVARKVSSLDLIKRIRSGDAVTCRECGCERLAEPESNLSQSLQNDVDIKDRVEMAIERAGREMQQDQIDRDQRTAAQSSMLLYCNCPPPKNTRKLSEMPKDETPVCVNCKGMFRPKGGYH